MAEPGYYSALFDNMLSLKEMQRKQTVSETAVASQRQEMQFKAEDQDRERREEQLLTQAFSGGQELRDGIEKSSNLMMQADRLAAAGARIMGINPKRGQAMIAEANTLRTGHAQQQLDNTRKVQADNELLNTVAMKVTDQASTDDAVVELARAGQVVPERFRKWGPDSQKYWESRASVSKQNIDALRIDMAERRATIAADAEKRLSEQGKADQKRKDDEAARKREGQSQAIDIAAEKEYDRLRKDFEVMEKPGWFSDKNDTDEYEAAKKRVEKAKERAYGTGERAAKINGKPAANTNMNTDSAAVAWAKSNPNDPRAKKIMELNK